MDQEILEDVMDIINSWVNNPYDYEQWVVATFAIEAIEDLKRARQGDITGDGKVDVFDLSKLSNNYGKTLD